MNTDVVGQTVVDTELTVEPGKLAQLKEAIGTDTAEQTALMVPFFGPTAAGQDSVVGPLGMDLGRALQGGQAYEWHRAFRSGEKVRMQVRVDDILDKGAAQFATVVAEFRSADGDLIQRQQTTFIERAET